MKKLLPSFLVVTLLNFSYLPVYAQSLCPNIEIKKNRLLNWLVNEQKVSFPKRENPKILAYKEVSIKDKQQYCKWCPLEPKPQLNMYINQKNEIWLADNAKEDQLVHELAHFLQSIENESQEDETSNELETQAVYWQNKYKETHENKYLCQ